MVNPISVRILGTRELAENLFFLKKGAESLKKGAKATLLRKIGFPPQFHTKMYHLITCRIPQLRGLYGLINVFPELEFRESTILLPKIFITATTAVTFPVSEFSVAFCVASVISRAVLVALIGRVSVEFKSMPVGLSNLKHLST